MKLSKKGYEKLFEFFMSGKYFDATKCDQIDFEPDDFEGMVCLTIEEAKSLLNMTKVFCICAQASNHKHLGHLIDLEKVLTNRIKQAEKGNEVE